VRIRTNFNSLTAYYQYKKNNDASRETLDRLTTGNKVNKPADDPIAFYKSEKAKRAINGLKQARNNNDDGLSMLRVAESSVNQINDMLKRMRELSVAAATGTMNDEQREMSQVEIKQLIKEINRLSYTTKFNGVNILSSTGEKAGVPEITVNDYTGEQKDNPVFQNLLSKIKDIITSAVEKVYDKTGLNVDNQAPIEVNFADGFSGEDIIAMADANSITINTEYISGEKTSPFSMEQVITHEMTHFVMLNNGISPDDESLWFHEGLADFSAEATDIRVKEYSYGAEILDSLQIPPDEEHNGTDYAEDGMVFKFIEKNFGRVELDRIISDVKDGMGVEDSISKELNYEDFTAFEDDFRQWATGYLDSGEAASAEKEGKGHTAASQSDPSAPYFYLHVNSDAGDYIKLDLTDTRTGNLDFTGFVNVSTQEDAKESIYTIDKALKTLTEGRTRLGAYINRLERQSGTLLGMEQNQTELLSRVKDADMAQEIVDMTKYNILINAGVSVMSQANISPMSVFSLLG